MVTIRHERAADIAAREVLLDLSFGACRFTKTSERLREGRRPADGLSLVATERGRLVGTVRLWHVAIEEHPALLLGPLAVHPDWRKCGAGAALMQEVLTQADHRGHAAVILVGDAPYYERFGFSADKTGELALPGPFERDRLLACELKSGSLSGAQGRVIATGLPVAPFSRRILKPTRNFPVRLPRAA